MRGVSAAQKRAAPVPELPRFRAPVVFGTLLLLFAVLIVRSLYLQWIDNAFLQEQGSSRYSREIERPRASRSHRRSHRRAACHLDPGEVDLGVPRPGRGPAGEARAAGAGARDDPAGAREETRRRQRLRLPRETGSARSRRAGRGAEDQGRPRPERIPAVLSGGRDGEPHRRVHRRPRRRAGRHRAHAAGMAGRQARQPPRDHQPARRRRRGRRVHSRAAGGPRTVARDRRPAAISGVPRAQGGRRAAQGESRRPRDPRRADRRDPGAGQLAHVQPERAQPRRARAGCATGRSPTSSSPARR